jgi:protein TonB
METSIIPVKLTKPNVEPPPPPSATKKKPIPKLKKALLKQKQTSMPLTTQPSDFAKVKPAPVVEPVIDVSMAAKNVTAESDATISQANAFKQTDINTNYDSNPKPDYPMIAKIRGWQGEVLLRVKVNESGISDAVEIERSSGFDALDESAVEAVKQWVFTPAKYGEEPIASAVIIPIVFTLSVGKQG